MPSVALDGKLGRIPRENLNIAQKERQRDGSNTNTKNFMILYLRTSKNIREHLEAYRFGSKGKREALVQHGMFMGV